MAPRRGQGGQNCTTRSVAVVRTHCSGTPERSIERIPVTFSSVLLLLLLLFVFVSCPVFSSFTDADPEAEDKAP